MIIEAIFDKIGFSILNYYFATQYFLDFKFLYLDKSESTRKKDGISVFLFIYTKFHFKWPDAKDYREIINMYTNSANAIKIPLPLSFFGVDQIYCM